VPCVLLAISLEMIANDKLRKERSSPFYLIAVGETKLHRSFASTMSDSVHYKLLL
jgi:hypothetical protein